MLDIGQSEDLLALQISLLPCLLGYHVIAKRLDELQKADPPKSSSRYRTWIDNYVAADYSAAVEKGCCKYHRVLRSNRYLTSIYPALIEKDAVHQSPKRVGELVKIFIQATKVLAGYNSRCFALLTSHIDGNGILGYGFHAVTWKSELSSVHFKLGLHSFRLRIGWFDR